MAAESDVPYKLDLDPANAQALVEQGGLLLFLDVPQGTSLGIDQQMFVVGPRFMGVKMVPPGPHFIYYSAASRHGGDTAPVTGFFLHMAIKQVVVRRWSQKDECLVPLADEEEEGRFATAGRRFQFDAHLAPYDLQHARVWQRLSKYISPAVIDRLAPVGGDISIMAEADVAELQPKTAGERRLIQHLAAQSYAKAVSREGPTAGTSENEPIKKGGGREEQPSSSGRCFYTPLERLVKRAGLNPEALTAVNLDKSEELATLLEEAYLNQEQLLLGELQFAFVAFLMGQSLEAFVQWKAICHLLGSCFSAPLGRYAPLFSEWLRVLYFQLRHSLRPDPIATSALSPEFEAMLDPDWLADDNFLKALFKEWLSNLREVPQVDPGLLRQAEKVRELLEESLGWDLVANPLMENFEDDEFAPMVVAEEDAVPRS